MHHFVDIHSSFFFLLHKQQHNRNRATHIYFFQRGWGVVVAVQSYISRLYTRQANTHKINISHPSKNSDL